MKRIILVLVCLAGAARAQVSVPRAECFEHPERWKYDRASETLAQPGQRFLADVRACDTTFAASVEEAVRYAIQTKEAQSFARNQTAVLAAYGVAWGLVALAALGAWLRWRRVSRLLEELEAKVKR
jgi:hypothetical protein